jgi:hypothetical protein
MRFKVLAETSAFLEKYAIAFPSKDKKDKFAILALDLLRPGISAAADNG